jgi:ABC-type transport system involved in cytochrome c biogenesis permease component
MRKPMAFLKKDFLMEVSYKFSFVLQFASIFFSVVMFYFVAKLLGDAPSVQSSLSEYGGNYFSFVLIGIAFSNFLSVGLGSFATNIRSEQMIGTLEAMLVTPTRLSNIVLSSSQWSFAFTSLRVGVYLLIGGLFFGVSFAGAAILPALLALILTIVAFSSLGIISASFIMVYKRGDPIAFALSHQRAAALASEPLLLISHNLLAAGHPPFTPPGRRLRCCRRRPAGSCDLLLHHSAHKPFLFPAGGQKSEARRQSCPLLSCFKYCRRARYTVSLSPASNYNHSRPFSQRSL